MKGQRSAAGSGPVGPAGPYAVVLVVEVDDESKRPASHGLGRDEGVLEGGLAARRNHSAQLQRREVLDVELVVLATTQPGQITGSRLRSPGRVLPGRVLSVPEGNGRRRLETPP